MTKIQLLATKNGQTPKEFLEDYMKGRTIKLAADHLGVSVSTLTRDLKLAGVSASKDQAMVFRRMGLRKFWGQQISFSKAGSHNRL